MMHFVTCQSPQRQGDLDLCDILNKYIGFLAGQSFVTTDVLPDLDKPEEIMGIEKFADNTASLIFATPY